MELEEPGGEVRTLELKLALCLQVRDDGQWREKVKAFAAAVSEFVKIENRDEFLVAFEGALKDLDKYDEGGVVRVVGETPDE
jgi:hypothetical protein